jgi:predicted enzyme related to lactoylglutathione lyase
MTNRPVLERAVPVLAVDDVAAAVAYYGSVFGFVAGRTWGSPPAVAEVTRDDVEIHLARRDAAAPAVVTIAYILVRGVDAYFAEVRARGGKIVQPLAERDLGPRGFTASDPAGNTLLFSEPVTK